MLTLKVEKRDIKKKGKLLRTEGKLPGVFYGRKEAATAISVSKIDFSKMWKEAGESTIVTLSHEGKDLSALVLDVQKDPVRGEPIHVDFYIVEADKEVEIDVPLEFVGVSPAVRDAGGTLVKVLRELEISGLPKNLPKEIQVDISSLKTIEDQIAVKDLVLPPNIKVLAEPEEIVAAISVAKVEEEAPVEEFDATKIEVEKKGKVEEEGEEGAVAEGGEEKGKAEGSKGKEKK